MNRKGFALIIIVGIIAVIAIAGIVGYFVWRHGSSSAPGTQTQQAALPATHATSTVGIQPTSTIDTSKWQTYKDASSGLTFAFPPLGTSTQVFFNGAGLYPGLNTLLDINIAALDPVQGGVRSVASIFALPNPSHEDLKTWFENNVDDASGTLLASGAFAQKQLPNGSAVVDVGPVPGTYQGGPFAQAYLLAPAGDRIYSITQSQDGSLTEFGYPASSVSEILDTVLGTVTQPTSTIDTSNWKTYTNQQYGFSFKYPADWILRNGTSQSNDRRLSIGLISPSTTQAIVNNPNTDFPTQDGIVFVDTNPENLSMEEYYTAPSDEDYFGPSPEASILSETSTVIGGVSAEHVIVLGGETSPDEIIVPQNNFFLRIETDINSLTFQQILSTFKFFQSISSANGQDWTQMSFDGLFSIKIPPELQMTEVASSSGLAHVFMVGFNRSGNPDYWTVGVINVYTQQQWNAIQGESPDEGLPVLFMQGGGFVFAKEYAQNNEDPNFDKMLTTLQINN